MSKSSSLDSTSVTMFETVQAINGSSERIDSIRNWDAIAFQENTHGESQTIFRVSDKKGLSIAAIDWLSNSDCISISYLVSKGDMTIPKWLPKNFRHCCSIGTKWTLKWKKMMQNQLQF